MTVIDFVLPAPSAEIVSTRAPVGVVDLVVMVTVVPVPLERMDVGENTAEAPDGKFPTEKLFTGPPNPPRNEALTRKVVACPLLIV